MKITIEVDTFWDGMEMIRLLGGGRSPTGIPGVVVTPELSHEQHDEFGIAQALYQHDQGPAANLGIQMKAVKGLYVSRARAVIAYLTRDPS